MVQLSEPALPSSLRRHNGALVLRAIRRAGPISRAAIARETGLSKPTVNEVVEELIETGLVEELERYLKADPPRPGRRAHGLSFRADAGYLLGIDIGANKVAALLANLEGVVMASERRPVGNYGRPSSDVVLGAALQAVSTVIARAAIDVSRVRGAAVGTPGVVDPESGRVTLAPQIAGWEGKILKRELAQSLPCHILVDNEVHLAMLGERWKGAAQGVDDAVFINVGVGIGAGVVVGGVLYRGGHGAAGEVGYLPILQRSLERAPDGIGQFEYQAGGAAYARAGRAAAGTRQGAQLKVLAEDDLDAIDAELVFRAALEGDRTSQRIVRRLTERLARGVAALAVILDPSVVILGGGISRAGDALLQPVRRRLIDLMPLPPEVVLSRLGDEAVALGAVWAAREWVDRELLTPSSRLE